MMFQDNKEADQWLAYRWQLCHCQRFEKGQSKNKSLWTYWNVCSMIFKNDDRNTKQKNGCFTWKSVITKGGKPFLGKHYYGRRHIGLWNHPRDKKLTPWRGNILHHYYPRNSKFSCVKKGQGRKRWGREQGAWEREREKGQLCSGFSKPPAMWISPSKNKH